MTTRRGFTLIETLVYIALLGMLLTGGVLASYQLLQGSATVSIKTTVQDEGSFVLRKVAWAMSGASGVSPAGTGSALTVTRHDSNTVDFRLASGVVEMRESAIDATWRPITTPNVLVQSLSFVVGSSPASVVVTVSAKTKNGTDAAQTFALTKYVRN